MVFAKVKLELWSCSCITNNFKHITEGDCDAIGTMIRDIRGQCVCDYGFAGARCAICAKGYNGTDCSTCKSGYMRTGVSCLGNMINYQWKERFIEHLFI